MVKMNGEKKKKNNLKIGKINIFALSAITKHIYRQWAAAEKKKSRDLAIHYQQQQAIS